MKLKDIISSALSRKTIYRNCQDIIRHISVEIGERPLTNYVNLERTRDYIIGKFREYGAVTTLQEYVAEGKSVCNIIAEIKGTREPERIIIVGAHYDTVEGTPGADDNTTAVAGLLEMYRLLAQHRPRRTIRFVAFTLEEPPFFSSELMGSMQYAKNCQKKKEPVDFMVCLEMLGFGGRRCRQNYPLEDMRRLYPSSGNFLAVVSLPSSSEYAYLWRNAWNGLSGKKIYDMIGPSSIPGISFSDHYSFNRHGFKSIMLTDTAFFRNTNYHTEKDTIDTLNFKFLSYNIWYSYLTLLDIANRDVLPHEKAAQN
jgi:Zn-dependent M28 family amino/carboxypeptidase